jgi:hypothetical protein
LQGLGIYFRGAGKGVLYGGLGGAVVTVVATSFFKDATIKGASSALVGGIAGAVSGSVRVIVGETTDADYLAGISSKLRRMARGRS